MPIARREGLEIVKFVKRRPDTRTILLVHHPEHGKCMLKTTCLLRRPRLAFAARAVAEFVMRNPAPIFPEILSCGPDHTLERYVEGETIRRWMKQRMDEEVLAGYFREHKRWSIAASRPLPRQPISAAEADSICRAYIAKCISHVGYLPAIERLPARATLLLRSGRIERRLQRLARLADEARLPRAMMCGDMSNVNLKVDVDAGKIYNIDYEFMGAGHWGFDAAYFVSAIHKLEPAPEVRQALRDLVLTEEWLGGSAAGAFFREFADLMSEIGGIVFRNGR